MRSSGTTAVLRAEAVVLADGRDAVVRSLEVHDRPGLQALFDAASPEDLYTRFFGVGRAPIRKHLDHLFSGDRSVVTYVVTTEERTVGVADVELLPDGKSAEIAFMVADDMHGCGVATLLLERAARDARGAASSGSSPMCCRPTT